MATFDFNVADYTNTEYELIDAGEYDALIIESEDKPTRNGAGRLLELKIQIVSQGKFQNRLIYDRLNLWNRSEKATAIARGELASIARAVGVPTPKDSRELHNKRLRVVIAVEKREDNGALQNTVKSYKPVESQIPMYPVDANEGRKPW